MKYIGARYMPKFMGDYDATTAYEALSVVDNGSGTSYVSNKPVPAGTPLTDTSYWTIYGTSSGAIINLQNQIDDINTKISNAEIRNVLDYGAVGDGVIDDTAAITSALDNDVVLYFPPEHTFKITNLVIDKKNVTLTGGAWIEGTIIIRQPWPNNDPANTFITGLTFNGGNPITIDRAVGVKIFENRFYNVEKAISIIPSGTYDSGSYSHVVEDVNIFNNYVYMCDYFVYSTTGTISGVSQDYLYLGDLTVMNNQVKVAKITHMYVSNCDGAIISQNVFYHFGSSSRVATKQRCIHFYNYVAGAHICDNRLFEPGLEGIVLTKASGCIITDNHIIQPGQVNLSSAILITSAAASGDNMLIADNYIYAPSKYGIELVNATRVQMNDNFVFNPVSDYAYYGEDFSNPPMSSVTHYGVHYHADSGINYDKIIAKNVCTNSDILYSGFINTDNPEQWKTATAAFDLDDASIINANPSSAVTISSLNTTHLYNGQIVTIVAYNGNLTIQSGTYIRLAGGTDYHMPSNSVLQLKYMTGILWEIGRTET